MGRFVGSEPDSRFVKAGNGDGKLPWWLWVPLSLLVLLFVLLLMNWLVGK